MSTRRTNTRRFFDSLTTDGVERAEANGPPTAFRIWKRGSNVTDHGPTIFSDRSAALLAAEQATRGNRYSIDVDHMSLDKSAPIENHAAVGWFSLEVRAGELWATAIEWVNDTIRAGLSKGAWKYMSPAYDVDEDGEVISFLNLSLTANPATHATTALASRGANSKDPRKMAKAKSAGMKWGDIKAALDGDDEDAKASAYAAIRAAFPEAEPDGDEPKEKPKDAEEAPEKKDAEEAPEKKDAAPEPEKKDGEDAPEKKDAKASVTASIDAELRRVSAELAGFRAERDAAERKTLLAGREMSAALAKTLEGKPLALVKEICATLPVKTHKSVSTETIQATRGATNTAGERASRLPAAERKALDEQMGVRPLTASIHWERTSKVFPVLAQNPATKKEGN